MIFCAVSLSVGKRNRERGAQKSRKTNVTNNIIITQIKNFLSEV